MAIEKVREYFRSLGIEERIHEFEVSSATVELAAAALGCDCALIAKSLTFMVNGTPTMVVAAGDAKIDNGKFKRYFGEKAKMLKADEVSLFIGHDVGGVCPFAVNDGVRIYIDESILRFKIVYPACGSSNSAIPLTPDELKRYSGALGIIDVCRLQEPEA